MDRLSDYASREAGEEEPETRREKEMAATAKLLEDLKLAKENKAVNENKKDAANDNANGEGRKDGEDADTSKSEANGTPSETTKEEESTDGAMTPGTSTASLSDGKSILSQVKLFEIFYDQVVKLVNAQDLPIQDTTALLVSLANLAL